jgi:hypothetical protein
MRGRELNRTCSFKQRVKGHKVWIKSHQLHEKDEDRYCWWRICGTRTNVVAWVGARAKQSARTSIGSVLANSGHDKP